MIDDAQVKSNIKVLIRFYVLIYLVIIRFIVCCLQIMFSILFSMEKVIIHRLEISHLCGVYTVDCQMSRSISISLWLKVVAI